MSAATLLGLVLVLLLASALAFLIYDQLYDEVVRKRRHEQEHLQRLEWWYDDEYKEIG